MLSARKQIFVVVFLMVIVIIPNFISAWSSDYDSWQYSKIITINGSTSGLVDYQVPVNITTAFYNNTGLVGSWHFTANSAEDSSGYGNRGTLSGGVNCNALGKFGGGCEFDGVDDSIQIPHSSSLKPSSQITISAWVKPTSITTNGQYEIYRKEDGDDRHLFSFQENGTILSFGISTGGSYAELDVPITASDYQNSWHYLVATYNGSDKIIYKDGVQIGSASASGNLGTTGTSVACIGAYASGGAQCNAEFFNGTIDEVKIYNRALSTQEIQDIYNAGKVRLDLQDIRFTEPYRVYELPVNISGADLTDYQVLVNITDTTIISHMRADGGDIRFFNYTTDTPYINQTLPFWVESITANNALIWLKTNVSASGLTIYMYYGNVSATYDNSLGGNNTFEFFDDFDGTAGTAPDSSKWTVYKDTYGVAELDGSGRLKIASTYTGGSGTDGWSNVYSNSDIGDDVLMEFKWQMGTNWEWFPSVTGYIQAAGMPIIGNDVPSNAYYANLHYGTLSYDNPNAATRVYTNARFGGTDTDTWNYDFTSTTTAWIRIAAYGATIKTWVSFDRSTWTLANNNVAANDLPTGRVGFQGGANGDRQNDNRIDYVLVRKYAVTEPTATIGYESVMPANNEASLNHWLESDNLAWVKVPSVAANANTTLYLYYGYSNATYNNALGGENTFLFFDDFDTYDTSKWDDWYCTQPDAPYNSILELSVGDDCGGYRTVQISRTSTVFPPIAYRTKLKYANTAGTGGDHHFGFTNTPIWDNQAMVSAGEGPTNPRVITRNPTDTQIQTYGSDMADSYHVWDGLWGENSFSGYVDGSLMYTNDQYLPTVGLKPTISNAKPGGSEGATYVDWFLLRNYASIEPSVISIGSEEIFSLRWLKTYSSSGSAKSFFAANESVTIKAKTDNVSGKITVTGPDGTVLVSNAVMANETALSDGVLVWNYSFNLTGQKGWYDVRISGNEQPDAFFVGGIWQNNWTDSEGNLFPFRMQVNISEPDVIERFFEPVDTNLNFAYSANSSSIRVAQWNGTDLIDIPSQSYNITYSGSYAASGNVVFLSTQGKGQNATYYIYYARRSQALSYSTDLSSTNNSGIYEIQNINYRVVLNETKGGIIQDAYNKKGTNGNLAGYSPTQLSPEALGGSLYRAFNLAIPSISLSNGTLFARYGTSGTYGNMRFNMMYKYYSHTQYIIIETNTSPAAGETWDYYYDQNFRLKDGSFTKAIWKNSSGIFEYGIGAGNGADITAMGGINWIGAYNNASGDSFGTIFLSNSQSQSINLNSEFYDDGGYERYRRRQFSDSPSSVTASDYFYSKTAIVIWNALDGYEKLNETYNILTNPLNKTVGISETSDTQNPAYTTANYTPQNPADNESATCFSYWTDNLELDHATVTINSSGRNNQSTVQINSNESWLNYTIGAEVLEAGSVTCNITIYDVAGLSNSTTIIFNVSDTTAPYFGQITNSPNTSAGLDPNVQINITANITEYSNMSSAFLQYKNSSSADWQNINMDKTWNGAHNYSYFASFVPESESIWQYRVYSNDTLGNANYSQATNLSVYYDWEWRSKPADFGAISGVLGSNITVGSLAINNTADAEIVFRLTSNWHDTDKVYFNGTSEGSDGFNITVGNNSVATVSVKVTAQQIERSDGLNLTISSLNSSAIPLKNSTSATIVSYASGPFLLVDITEYPISSTQGDSNVVLKAKVQNKGNETATGVWLAFELPAGWTATSGSLNKSIGVLAVDSIGYNQISASISESAAAGEQTLSAKSGSFQNKTGVDSVSLAVAAKSSSSTVTETIVTSSGGGAAGASASTSPVQIPGLTREQKDKLFQTEETYELVRGKSDNFTLKIENPLDGDLEDVSLRISGFLSQYLSVEPSEIDRIPANESSTVIVHITAPKYFTSGTHYLNFTISGLVSKTTTGPDNSTKITQTNMVESRSVTLLIQEISRDDALQYIEKGAGIVREINMAGLANRDLEMLIIQAENALRNRDYADVKAIYEALTEKKEKLTSTLDLLDEVSVKISEAENDGITVSTTTRLMMLARSALERGDYDTALKRAEDAKMTYALETTGKMNMMVYAKNNWRSISLAAVLIMIISYFGLLSLRYNLASEKLKSLRKEEEVLMSLIKEIQRECFDEGKMGMDEYIESLLQYEKKMSSVIKETIKAESVKENMFRFFRSFERTLDEERAKLLDLIKNTQSMYLESGKIETRVYEFRMKSYAERLAEIEEKLADIDAKRTIRKQSFGV